MLTHPGSFTVKKSTGPLLLPFGMFLLTLVLLAFAILLYLVIAAEAAPAQRNLSGIWIFNPAESKLEVPPPNSMTFRIEQTETDASFVRTRTVGSETDTWQLRITTDGTEAIQERARMQTHYRVYWRGDTLVLDSALSGDDYSATNVVEYSLSADGRRLIAIERFKGPQLRYRNVWVFDRK